MNVPTLFMRATTNDQVIPKLTPGCEWVMNGDGNISIMLDGMAVRVTGDVGTSKTMARRVRGINAEGQHITAWIPCSRENPADKYLWEAFDAEKPVTTGIWEVIGPQINGNPQNVPNHRMWRVLPAGYQLLVYGHSHKIERGFKTTAESLYKDVYRELADPACNVEGICFQIESWTNGLCTVTKAAKIRKKDFGLPWPAPRLIDVTATVEVVPGSGLM